MTVGQRERRVLQEALMSALGDGATDTMMTYLPPVGWADVATKQDLEHLATKEELAVLAGKVDVLAVKVEACDTRDDVAALAISLKEDLQMQFNRTMALMVTLFGAFTAIILKFG